MAPRPTANGAPAFSDPRQLPSTLPTQTVVHASYYAGVAFVSPVPPAMDNSETWHSPCTVLGDAGRSSNMDRNEV
jgi:hypothetical protein